MEENKKIQWHNAFYPAALFLYLRTHGYAVTQRQDGIYDITGRIPFRTQIVVTAEVNPAEYAWITKLRRNLTEAEATQLTQNCSKLYNKRDVENASSVFDAAFRSNEQLFFVSRRCRDMYEALDVIFKDRVEEWVQKEKEWNQEKRQWNQEKSQYQDRIAQLEAQLAQYEKDSETDREESI